MSPPGRPEGEFGRAQHEGTPVRAAPVARLRAGQVLHLAWRDLWHERWLALCTACVLAATLAPLWTLWGLERGVIAALIERRERDPLMRQIDPETTGNGRFDAAWFARVAAWPDVSFLIPTVRSSAALVEAFSDSTSGAIDLRETAPGDPLLAGLNAPTGQGVVLSAGAAARLRVTRGQRLRIALSRQRDGREEPQAVTLEVVGVLPLSTSSGNDGYAAPALLAQIEAWRDGYTVPSFGPVGNGPAPARAAYPRFRLHAASIRDVQGLAQRLETEEKVSTRTNARAIESDLALQRNLRTVLGVIAAVTVSGAVVALAALQIATVRRKRREYALLKLTGHGRAWLVAMPCLNALAVALLGGAMAFGVYALAALTINRHFAIDLEAGEAAVRLHPADVAAGVLATMVVSVLPALWGGWRASNVEAADELRDN